MPETFCRTDRYGNKYWENKEGQCHRTDGPAVEYVDGMKHWYQNDEPHRTDGPAIEYANGSKDWYQNGVLHRTDGPAVERVNGKKEFHVRGIPCTTFKEFFDAIPKENREASLLLINEFKNV